MWFKPVGKQSLKGVCKELDNALCQFVEIYKGAPNDLQPRLYVPVLDFDDVVRVFKEPSQPNGGYSP